MAGFAVECITDRRIQMKFTNKTPEVKYYFILDGSKTSGVIYYEHFGVKKFQWKLMFGNRILPAKAADIVDLCQQASSDNLPVEMMDNKVGTEIDYIAVMPKEL